MSIEDNSANYRSFGYGVLGPFLNGFVSWLAQSLVRREIDKVFFLSRDGHLMMQAFREVSSIDRDFDCRYVYFSRNSIRRALLWTCSSFEESLRYFSNCRFTTLNEIAAYYGLTEELVVSLHPEASDVWNQPIDFSCIARNQIVRSIYVSFESRIKEISKQQSDLLRRYLIQEGMVGKCAIVDIGWHGSMQHYLEEFVSVVGIEALFHGFYVGHTPSFCLKGSADGWVYDRIDSPLRKKVLCFFGVIEKFFQTQEGSTRGYSQADGVVSPVLEAYEFEGDRRHADLLRIVQNGALDYVKDNRGAAADAQPWAKMIAFGTSPTLAQTQMFAFLCNNDGAKTFFLPQKALFAYAPNEFVHALSDSAWKTGFMKMAFKLPFPYYAIYKLLRK